MLDSNLSSVGGGVAAGSDLDAAAGFALNLELDQPEVVAFSEDITGLFSNVGVRWGGHQAMSLGRIDLSLGNAKEPMEKRC